MADKIEGYLMVGTNEQGEVVVNLDRDRTGHIVFSPAQARTLAALLLKKAAEAVDPKQSPRIPPYVDAWPGELSRELAATPLAEVLPEEAYRQGIWAFSFGSGLHANPYPPDADAHDQWANGWSDGETDNEG